MSTIKTLNEALVTIRTFNNLSKMEDVFIFVVTNIHSKKEASIKVKNKFKQLQRKGRIGKNSIIESMEIETENYGGGSIPYMVI